MMVFSTRTLLFLCLVMRMSQGTWMVLSAQEAGSTTFRPEDLDFFEKRIRLIPVGNLL